MIINERNEKITSIYYDIVNKEIDLKPDFQRGEVWPIVKKKLLIDSIFREWHVPPIHVVLLSNGKSEVLDGQQRLTAIKEFIENKYSIDGAIEPKDQRIKDLGSKKYRDLDNLEKRLFDRALLKIYEIRDYNYGEPSELFYRLNQTVKLTSAEARNSIYGEVREDIEQLVDFMEDVGVTRRILGFSNSRMAYNDMLSRLCLFIEQQSLRETINDSVLNQRFRDRRFFSPSIINAVKTSLIFISNMQQKIEAEGVTLNLTKASSLNWMFMIARLSKRIDEKAIGSELESAFLNLEIAKYSVKNNSEIPEYIIEFFDFDEATLRELILIYIERSSSRVMSVGSILIRDIILNVACHKAGIELALSKKDQGAFDQFLLELDMESDPKPILENLAEVWLDNLR
jgi:hypothetical protein